MQAWCIGQNWREACNVPALGSGSGAANGRCLVSEIAVYFIEIAANYVGN
jgi:hypothetical protein